MRVLLQVKRGYSLDQLTTQIRNLGGQPIQLFPPSYLIAEVDDTSRLDRGEPFTGDPNRSIEKNLACR